MDVYMNNALLRTSQFSFRGIIKKLHNLELVRYWNLPKMFRKASPKQLNPFDEDVALQKNNRTSWNPRKMFLSRHKRTPSFATPQLTTENVEREPIPPTDEEVTPSRSVHRKMSQDTSPIEPKCRTNESTLRRKKQRAPPPPFVPITFESSSCFAAMSITDLCCRDTIELETVVTITTTTATTDQRNEVDRLPLLFCHSNNEES